MNFIEKANDTISSLGSLASTHREKISKSIINGVLLFVIFAVFGCFDFLTLKFNIDALLTLEYWTAIVTKTIAGVCAFNIGINIQWDVEIKKSDILRKLKAEYERLIKFIDDKSFEYYVVEIFNKSEKRKAWIDKINRKIYWLNKFSKHKDMILYNTSNEEEKAKNKYCIKRAELEKLKSEEYIEQNIDSLVVKYGVVDPIVFSLEIDCKTVSRGAKVQGNASVARAKKTTNVILGILGISMFTTSLIVSANQQQFEDQMIAFWNYFLRCVEDVGVVLWQLFRGMLATRKIIDSEFIQVYAGRIRVLNGYVNWCNENNIEESKAYRIMKKLDESEANA